MTNLNDHKILTVGCVHHWTLDSISKLTPPRCSHLGKQQGHSAWSRNSGLILDSPLLLTVHPEPSSRYSDGWRPLASSLHSPRHGLLALLQTCSMRSLSELFCSLWLPCSSSPRYPRGAFPNLIHVSFQISHYLRRFLWWPSPILSPPISLTWFIQFHSAYYHRAHSMHVYLYLSPSRMQASQVQGLCMVYCYTPHAWDSVWPSKYIEWRNDWWLCSGIRVTIIGFML